MLPEILALMCALSNAVAAVALRPPLRNISAIAANAIRAIVASMLMLGIAFVCGDFQSVRALPGQFAMLVVSVLISFGVGDTLYLKSMKLTGVSLSVSVLSAYPLFVIPGAVLLLGERPSDLDVLGAIAITTGLVMAGRAKRSSNGDEHPHCDLRLGLFLALGAAVLRAIGVLLVAVAVRGLDPLAAIALRLPILALFLLGGTVLSGNIHDFRRVTSRSGTLLSIAGVAGMGLSPFFFFLAVELTGASRSVPLSSTSPIFAALLAFLILREKVDRWTWAAALLVTLGAVMVI